MTAHDLELPKPISPARLVSQDGRRVVLLDTQGGLWLLNVTPEKRSAEVIPVPVTVDPAQMYSWSASQDLGRLLILTRDAPLRVIEVPSGRTLYEHTADAPDAWNPRARCLTPDGRHLIEMNETETRLRCLDEGGEPGPLFQDWHRVTDAAPRADYLDSVDALLAHPRPHSPAKRAPEPAPFYLLAACYGFVTSRVVAVMADGRPFRQANGAYQKHRTREFSPRTLPYDPTYFAPPFGQRHALARDQCGAGLAALDPETGEMFDFPSLEDTTRGYGYIRGALPCGAAPLAWVRTASGDFLWHLDGRDSPREALHDCPLDVIALYPDALIYADGHRLFWGDIR